MFHTLYQQSEFNQPMPQLTKYILSIYGALALYALGDFSYRNGYINIVLDKRQAWLTSPQTDPRKRPQTTGIESLDETLATMFVFYWPVLDGSFPGLSLMFCNYFGTITLSLVLVSLESLRKGNRTSSSSSFFFSPTLWGMIGILVTLAISIPWYLLIHLSISTTASHPTIENLSIPIHELRALVVNVIVGLILPCVLVALPETITQILFTRQTAIALWQLWPFWSTAVHFIAKKFFTESEVDPKTQRKRARTALRSVYVLAFAVAAITHIATWAISLTTAYALPNLMDAETVSGLHPTTVFLNTWPSSSIQTESVGEGTLWLIQWDQFFAAGAMYWWSVDLYIAAHATQGKEVDWYALALKTIAFCLISGFTGATIELLWEREEMVGGGGGGNS